MSLESFYTAINGDLADVRGRLQADDRIEKFLKMFMMDTTYQLLLDSHASGDVATEFRAAHTLKGTSKDMGLTDLNIVATELAEALRPNDEGQPTSPEKVDDLESQVIVQYELVQAAAEEHLE